MATDASNTTGSSRQASNSEHRTLSPYTLSSSDSPGSLFTHIQLRGVNYDEWSKGMMVALSAKKKHGFINGGILKPADNAEEIDDWWVVNSMIISWIFNTIEPSLRSTISYHTTAKKLWEDIRQRFSGGNGPKIQQLKDNVTRCRQNGDTVMQYYGKLKKLWDELNDNEQFPACTCHGDGASSHSLYQINLALHRLTN